MIATVVSSYPKIPNRPRPARLRNAINRFDRGAITEEDIRRIEDEVTEEALQEQAEAGLDLVTDGQIRWEDEQTYLARQLRGISLNGLIRWFDTNMYYRQPVIESAIAWQKPITVDDYRFAAEHSEKPVKPVLTGPYTLARLSVDQHYGSVGALAKAFAGALNQEAKALQEAGAMMVVLECIPTELAAKITSAINIPTIGIGAGVNCDGQVLVLYDLLGISRQSPHMAKNFLAENGNIREAIAAYVAAVKSGSFPAAEHSFV